MSSTYLANIVTIIALILPYFGIHVANPGTLTNALLTLAGVASTLYIFYGRYKAGGISAFGLRKD